MNKRQKSAFLRDLTELSRKHGITLQWDYDGLEMSEFDESDAGGRYLSDADGVYWVAAGGLARILKATKERLAFKRFQRSPEYARKMADDSEHIFNAEKLIAEKGLRSFNVHRHQKSVSPLANPSLGAIL